MRRLSVRRAVAGTAAALVALPLSLLGATQASAVTGGPGAPETLPATASAIWQTNDAVWATVVNNGVLYAAGDFTSVRPPGAAKGTSETPMSRIVALHADGPTIGQPCTAAAPCPGIGAWTDKKVDGRVWALNVSPDGRTLYAGGDFIYVSGKSHRKAAAFNVAASGGPVLTWDAQISGGTVRAITSTATTLYVGGSFTTVAGVSRPQTAAFNAASAYAFLPGFGATVDGSVYALLAGPGSRLVLGGHFRNVNGEAHSGIAQVDLATGKVNGPMSNAIIPNIDATHYSDVKTLITDGTTVYVGAEGTGRGIFDGQAAVDPTTGNLVWKDNCLGATQALALIGNVLYVGSHSHDCSTVPTGGFPQKPYDNGPGSWHHLLAMQARTGGSKAGGQLLTWYPTLNSGPTNAAVANELGPRALATDGTTLFVGGQSTKVNGVAQQGLTMFTPGGNGAAPAAVTATAVRVGNDVTVRFTSASDQDDTTLSYAIYRDGTPVSGSANQPAPFWVNAGYVFRDRGAPAGASYTVVATDANGLTSSTSVTPTTSTGYKATVLADAPSLYWRLNEASGTVVADSSGKGATGTYRATTLKRAGAIDADTAAGQTGASGQTISQTAAPYAPPKNYSLEAWFRTTSTSGGRLIGWSNAATGTSTKPDRTIYMDKAGQLLYGTFQTTTDTTKQCAYGSVYFVAGTCYVWGKQAYNDGGWHHVVVTQSATAGASLYVDGVLIGSLPLATAPATATGVWRIGYDASATKFELEGTTLGWNGDVDEVAVYPTVLSAARVAAHYQAGN